MAQQPTPVDVSDLPDLLRLAEEVRATRRPRVLRRGDEDLAVLMPLASQTRAAADALDALEARIWADVGLRSPDDPWASYDPARAARVIRQSAGVLAGADHETLLADLATAREQDSPGRPA